MKNPKKVNFFIASFVIFFMPNILGAMSESYTVGGEDKRWDISVDYGSWSRQFNFSVGDVLVFKYNKGQHNVYQVNEDTYQSCNASTGVFATYLTGNDEITLKNPQKYWFICDIEGHCLGGMRFGIDVKEATVPPPPDSTEAVVPPPPPPPLSSGGGCDRKVEKFWSVVGIVVLFSSVI